MRFSRSFQASSHCQPSPNGAYVATLSGSTIDVRDVESLQTIRETDLHRSFLGPACPIQWSPSSKLVLVASTDEIYVFSACEDEGFHATIRNPVPPAARPVYVGFGAFDTDVIVCASLGLRFAVFDLASSAIVEIANPKFHMPATVRKGFCFRPASRHLAVITRTSGKDMVSIHHPKTKELQRSWYPDTVDAQGIVWSPDGQWLVTWESAAHGHKTLFYTPDGNLFKVWSGPQPLTPAEADINLGPGVRLLDFAADGSLLAIGDSSSRICVLNMASITESLRLQHPSSIVPTDTLQVWQEQLDNSNHHFVRALQTISAPNEHLGANHSASAGCAFLSFDPSSALLVTRLEEAPSTVWIWDTAAAELRAVLLFHGSVSRTVWHPVIRETLLITCDGDAYNQLVFLWDPLSEGPKCVDFSGRLAGGQVQPVWLNAPSLDTAALFVCNNQSFVLASLAEDDAESAPWVPEDENSGLPHCNRSPSAADAYDEEASELDDTFCFKKT